MVSGTDQAAMSQTRLVAPVAQACQAVLMHPPLQLLPQVHRHRLGCHREAEPAPARRRGVLGDVERGVVE